MSGVSPVIVYSPAQPPQLPTPSPFSFSVTSTRRNTTPSIHLYNLILRFMAFLFSFISALSLAAPPPKKKKGFWEYPELLYCFIVTIVVFSYSAYQLFKGVWDIAYRGILISDKTSDYISFILDQLAGYLLVSSSSVTMLAILRQIEQTASLWKSAVVSVTMSFAAFLVIVVCALLSGLNLCKRIVW